jgi:hypothetical protein
MRLLLLNPNTSAAVTERLAGSARAAAAAGTQILPLTAPRGVPFIASRAEAQIAGAVALEMLAEHHGCYDADHRGIRRPGAPRRARIVRRADRRAGGGGNAHRLHARAAVLYRHLHHRHGTLVQGMRRRAWPWRALRIDPHAR